MNQRILAYITKSLKAKLRKPILSTITFVWPSLILLIVWICVPNMGFKGKPDYFLVPNYLPSVGFGKFTHGMFCRIALDERIKFDYYSSRYRVVYEILDKIYNSAHTPEKDKFKNDVVNFFQYYGEYMLISSTLYSKNDHISSNSDNSEFNEKTEQDVKNIKNDLMQAQLNMIFYLLQVLENDLYANELEILITHAYKFNDQNISLKEYLCEMKDEWNSQNLILLTFLVRSYILSDIQILKPINKKYKYNYTDQSNYSSYFDSPFLQSILCFKDKPIYFSPNTEYVKKIKTEYDAYFKLIKELHSFFESIRTSMGTAKFAHSQVNSQIKDPIYSFSGEVFKFFDGNGFTFCIDNQLLSIYSEITDEAFITEKVKQYTTGSNIKPFIAVKMHDTELNTSKSRKIVYEFIYNSYLIFHSSLYWSLNPFYAYFDSYFDSSLSFVQDLIDLSIMISEFNTSSIEYIEKSTSKERPEWYMHDQLYIINLIMNPLFCIIALFIGVVSLTYYLVTDRNLNLMEFLKTVGVDEFSYTLTVLMIEFLFVLISMIPFIFFSYYSKLKLSSILLYFILFNGYVASTFSLCYLVSCFLCNTLLAILINLTIHAFALIPYIAIRMNIFLPIKGVYQVLLSLNPYASFGNCYFGIEYIENFKEISVNLTNIFSFSAQSNELSIGYYLIMIYADSFLFFVLAYMANHRSTIKINIYYLFNKVLLVCKKYPSNKKDITIQTGDKIHRVLLNEEILSFDNSHPSLDLNNVSLICSNLSVNYDGINNVIKDLSVTFVKNKIYMLLGENGSGKTTLIKTLMNVLQPMRGIVKFNDFNEYPKMSIGYCPQNDILIDYFTVEENIHFYWRVKTNTSPSNFKPTIKNLYIMMDLKNKKYSLARNLSGGQKRKLCLGIAFIGDSPVMIFDEPTTGVDPESRRSVYEFIYNLRKDKTIIVSTHHMDEAEILGDEIMIMLNGKLIVKSTTIELKQSHPLPSKLNIETQMDSASNIEMVEFVLSNCTQVDKYTIKDNQVCCEINPNYKKDNAFGSFLKLMCEKREELGIKCFALNDPFMEDVFIEICSKNNLDSQHDNHIDLINILHSRVEHDGYIFNILNHFAIIFYRKISSNFRNINFYVSKFVIPIILVIFASFFRFIFIINFSKPSIFGFENVFNSNSIIMPIGTNIMDSNGNTNMLMNKIIYGSLLLSKMDTKNLKNVKINCSIYDTYTKIMTVSNLIKFHQHENVLIDWIGDCDLTKYLHSTHNRDVYKRHFSLYFKNIDDGNKKIDWTEISLSGEQLAGLPIAVNYLNNLALKLNAEIKNITDYDKYELTILNSPITCKTIYLQIIKFISSTFFMVILNLSIVILTSSFTFDASLERMCGFKKTKDILGMNTFSYWMAIYMFDYLISMIYISFTVLIFMGFRMEDLSSYTRISSTILTMLHFFFAAIPMSYLISFLIDQPIVSFTFNLFASLLIVFLENFQDAKYSNKIITNIKLTIEIIFKFHPYFNLQKSFDNIFVCSDNTYRRKEVLLNVGLKCVSFYYSFYRYFIISGTFFIFIHVLLILWSIYKQRVMNWISRNIKTTNIPSFIAETIEDVHDEEVFSNTLADKTNTAIILKRVGKVYNSCFRKRFHAVRDVSFAMKPKECFGLLGINGAGKTSIFKMITGEECITKGIIHLSNKIYGLKFNICPQQDNLDFQLTPREHLEYLCQLYGYNSNVRKFLTITLPKVFGFSQYLDVITGNMSFGNRRKLSSSIAVLGNPNLLLLDEATSAMDPISRKNMWNFMNQLKDSGTPILFISHNMNECEIYAERIAIMVKGIIKSIGSPEHIKQNYGYSLCLKYEAGDKNTIIEMFKSHFVTAIQSDDSSTQICYSLKINCFEIPKVFDCLKKLQDSGVRFIYQINQTNLETVFRSVARSHATDINC